MQEKTPGQKAYEAYQASRGRDWVPAEWEDKSVARDAWEQFAKWALGGYSVGDSRAASGLFSNLSWAYLVEHMPDLVTAWESAHSAATMDASMAVKSVLDDLAVKLGCE